MMLLNYRETVNCRVSAIGANNAGQVLIEDIIALYIGIIWVELSAGSKAKHDMTTMQNLSLILLNVLSLFELKKSTLGNI